jgi:hypothetical protein
MDPGQGTEGLPVFKRLKKRPPDSAQPAPDLDVLFDRRIFDYMLQELSKNLSVEEGGKYVGYLLKPGDPLWERIGSRAAQAIVIVDFLPSGPNAVRTAVELMPDGPYQEALFREIEQRDSAIEHVGTWHSHHCNGLRTLSDGDVKGYRRTVNKAAYRPDFLVASLVKDVPRTVHDVGWIDHFLFARGGAGCHKITDAVRAVDLVSPFGAITGHVAARRDTAEAQRMPQQQARASLWSDTPEGQRVLAEDKRFFDGNFDSVVTTRRESQVIIKGRKGSRALAVMFPKDTADQIVSVMVRVDDSSSLRIECELANRSLAYKAALAVLAAS